MTLELFKIWLTTLIGFLVVDLFWLGVVMKDFYHKQMGDLLRKSGDKMDPNWIAALILYAIMVAGLVIFVLPKLSTNMPIWKVFGWGFLYGFVMYSVYDLTNLAVVKNWPLPLTIVDLIWGGTIFGISAIIMFHAQKFFA